MAAKFPRFIITVDGQQAALAWNHDEAWFQTLALWRRGCVARCEPAELVDEEEPGAADAVPGEAAEAGNA